jgi:type IV secretion system protein VirD4
MNISAFKIIGRVGLAVVLSALISWCLVILFLDTSAATNPVIMLDYYMNITSTYPVMLYPLGVTLTLAAVSVLVSALREETDYGDAEFATVRDMSKMREIGVFRERGVILGKVGGRYVRTDESLSTLIVAPQGTGKTAALIIPTLFSDTRSFIVNDVKGELWDITSLQRSHFGRVGIFAPSKSLSDSLHWNPFDGRCLPSEFDMIVDFVDRNASILYPTEGDKLDATAKHFNAEAKSIFNFYALYLIWKNGATSLPEIFEFSLESDDVQASVAIILEEEADNDLPLSIRQNGNRILQKGGEELGGSVTTFTQALEPFSRATIGKHLRRCDFSHRDFRQDKPFTLYIYIPANDVARMAPLVRMLTEYLVGEFLSDNDQTVIKRQGVVFCMDEFPRMGYMKALKEAPALQRSYNITSIFVAQDKNQLETTYGQGSFDQFVTTTDFKAIFRQNEDTTSARFSNIVGKTTRRRKSVSRKDLDLLGSSSESKEGLPLILPQDFMNQKKNDIYILVSGHHERPIKAKCAWWFKDRHMKQLAGAYNGLTVAALEASTYISDPTLISETKSNACLESETNPYLNVENDVNERKEFDNNQLENGNIHQDSELMDDIGEDIPVVSFDNDTLGEMVETEEPTIANELNF